MCFKRVSWPLGKVFFLWSLLLYFGGYLLTPGMDCFGMSFVAVGAQVIGVCTQEKSDFSIGVMFLQLLQISLYLTPN